ncbi:hypothetical protein LA080_005506 [Diaporthe eres]|nr:hypothetical protein LA080_005506 [Diaporthe eres]
MNESLLCHPSAMRPDMPPEIRMAQDTSPTARIFVLSVLLSAENHRNDSSEAGTGWPCSISPPPVTLSLSFSASGRLGMKPMAIG